MNSTTPKEVKTVRDFVDLLLAKTQVTDARNWCLPREIKRSLIDAFLNRPFRPGSVVALGKFVRDMFRRHLPQDGVEKCHQFLKEIHEEATRQNLAVDIKDIDQPLTPEEAAKDPEYTERLKTMF